jgi:hypothetical protein
MATIPDAHPRPDPSDPSLRIVSTCALLGTPFRSERRQAARGPPHPGTHRRLLRAPHTKARPKAHFDRAQNEHQTREESLFKLQLATLLVVGEIA